jgi:hypothetical protein
VKPASALRDAVTQSDVNNMRRTGRLASPTLCAPPEPIVCALPHTQLV